VFGATCMLLCGLLALHFAQQTAGASWHPAFPAPSWISEGRKMKQSSGEQAARLKRHVRGSSCVSQTRYRRVGKAQRAHRLSHTDRIGGHGAVRLCPPYGTAPRDMHWSIAMLLLAMTRKEYASQQKATASVLIESEPKL